MKIEVVKRTSGEGRVVWKLCLNEKKYNPFSRYDAQKASYLLTKATDDVSTGIFTSAPAVFYWGAHKKLINLKPTFRKDQSAQDCLTNLTKNVQLVRDWVEGLRREHTGEQIARCKIKDF